eukprot:TRINITY_DN49392_c0_g1_i1.p1 TRINITY_DN49392_c0_g1~~TRINITY_DN49392_c0_g1_i1.p1  ORF type:complete len:474 (-),score=63.13 TRINITY_DN49392_c0_g1_i1:19-1440(-)
MWPAAARTAPASPLRCVGRPEGGCRRGTTVPSGTERSSLQQHRRPDDRSWLGAALSQGCLSSVPLSCSLATSYMLLSAHRRTTLAVCRRDRRYWRRPGSSSVLSVASGENEEVHNSLIPLLELGASGRPGATPILDACEAIGAFQVRAPLELARSSEDVFRLVSYFLDLPEARKSTFKAVIDHNGAPHGYQAQGSLGGKYNRHRSGIVLQGDAAISQLLSREEVAAVLALGSASSSSSSPAASPEFIDCIERWRQEVWSLADTILAQTAEELQSLGLQPPADAPMMFGQGGSFDVLTHSQTHIKKMHPAEPPAPGRGDEGVVRLHLHQDPSLFSLLLHASDDPPGQGLEMQRGGSAPGRSRSAGDFVPLARSGCGVVTLLVGQLFHALLGRPGGFLQSQGRNLAKGRHRVVTKLADMHKERLAATCFLQPAPDALLRLPGLEASSKEEEELQDSFGERRRRAYARYVRAEKPA